MQRELRVILRISVRTPVYSERERERKRIYRIVFKNQLTETLGDGKGRRGRKKVGNSIEFSGEQGRQAKAGVGGEASSRGRERKGDILRSD